MPIPMNGFEEYVAKFNQLKLSWDHNKAVSLAESLLDDFEDRYVLGDDRNYVEDVEVFVHNMRGNFYWGPHDHQAFIREMDNNIDHLRQIARQNGIPLK